MPASRRSRTELTAVRVVRASGLRGLSRAAPGRLTSTGRDAELATLSEHWEAARLGAGAAMLVLGEAGIGSRVSRLQLRECHRGTQHAWVETEPRRTRRARPFTP